MLGTRMVAGFKSRLGEAKMTTDPLFSGHDCDYALMGILDRHYFLVEVWKADYQVLKPVIGKHKRANPTIHQFKAIGTKVYP